jgi:hypothetical protein
MRRFAAFLAALLAATTASALDNVLMIQLRPGGGFTVWHTEGESRMTDDEAMRLEAAAKPDGSEAMQTSVGPARAYDTAEGVLIRLSEAKRDNALLVDRDNCGHIRLWHAAGETNPTEDQVTDIFMSALPEGGKRITLGDFHVKAFTTRLGVTASIWPNLKKP